MQINSALLLLVSFAFILAPAIAQWLHDGGTAWYRYHLIWLIVVVFVFLARRQKPNDEL